MSKRRVAAVAAATIVFLGAYPAMFAGLALYRGYRAGHWRVQLLCKTDHQALRDACRELAKQAAEGKLKARDYSIRFSPDRKISQFPEIIRTLRPDHVTIEKDGRVQIEMDAGSHDFGVYAYPENYTEPYSDFQYGDRELVKGLWYYDEFYRSNGKYDRSIDALLRKHGRPKKQ